MENGEIEIARIGINPDGTSDVREPVFVTVSEFRGTKFLNIRKHFEDNGEWKPTKKGITLRKEQYEDLLTILNSRNGDILKALD